MNLLIMEIRDDLMLMQDGLELTRRNVQALDQGEEIAEKASGLFVLNNKHTVELPTCDVRCLRAFSLCALHRCSGRTK